jgi:hypothetical protein
MLPLGFGITWLGYSLGLYGWCLIKGYNVTFRQLVNPVTIYTTWPPPAINDPAVIWPPGGSLGGAEGSAGPAPTTQVT